MHQINTGQQILERVKRKKEKSCVRATPMMNYKSLEPTYKAMYLVMEDVVKCWGCKPNEQRQKWTKSGLDEQLCPKVGVRPSLEKLACRNILNLLQCLRSPSIYEPEGITEFIRNQMHASTSEI